jgi:uncharacterized protein (UPF0305 family)
MFLLKVLPLPNEIVELIYGFMKVNAANAIGSYFKTAKQSNAVFEYLANYRVQDISMFSIYSIRNNANYVAERVRAHYLKDEVITKLYNNLIIMYKSHYRRVNYSRNTWHCVLNNISQILMYYYNRLAFSDSLKKNNVNYNYLKRCIELWFKLCQKYNFYLSLFYLDSAKKVKCTIKAIQLRTRTIKNFAEFRVSPLVTMRSDDYCKNLSYCKLIAHHSLLGLDAYARRLY